MNKGKYVFSQLLDFLDRNDFNYLARKYSGDKYVKQFTCYNQLCVLMFWQLSNRESLWDVLFWQPRLTSRRRITLDLVGTLPRVLLQMPTRSAIIASTRSLLSGSSQRLNDVEIDVCKLNRDIYAFNSTTVDYSHRISAMNFPINNVLIVTIFVEIITAND